MCCHEHMGSATQCCCGHAGHYMARRFFSKEERIANLKNYLQNLQQEIAEVEKRIKSLEENDDENHHCCC